MNELALFAGAGGGILGGQILGWHTVCAVEWNAYAASVLCARQNDGLLPPFPIWDDVRTFDGRPWRGRVDVVSGGFPCQDISVAGKGDGLDGERSGLWSEMARIIGEVRPRFAFVENSPALTSRGLGRVLGDLAALGYDARWGVVSAADAGALHRRERIWIVANAISSGAWNFSGEVGSDRGWRARRNESPLRQTHWADGADRPIATSNAETAMADTNVLAGDEGRASDPAQGARGRHSDRGSERAEVVAYAAGERRPEAGSGESGSRSPWGCGAIERFWDVEPDVGRVAHGVAARVDRLTAIGNGQVPQCAALAWRCLMESA